MEIINGMNPASGDVGTNGSGNSSDCLLGCGSYCDCLTYCAFDLCAELCYVDVCIDCIVNCVCPVNA